MSYDDVEIEDMQWNEELQASARKSPVARAVLSTSRSSTTPRTSPTTNLRTTSTLKNGKPSPLLEALKNIGTTSPVTMNEEEEIELEAF
ncbi:hypothetical protein V6N13_115323 [Hibiscus sabdariffa]